MSFYSLDHLCRYLKIPRKLDPGSFKTWMLCMDGDEKAQKHMVKYNKWDVSGTLEPVYLRMRGWMKNHPIMNLYTRKLNHCPVCMSSNYMLNGPRLYKTGWKQRVDCKDCGKKWVTELKREDPKIDITLV